MRTDLSRPVPVCAFMAAVHAADRCRRPQPTGPVNAAASFKLVQWIREEFEDAPGLSITVDEAARFWALEEPTSRVVLSHLLAVGFLMQDEGGRYRQVAWSNGVE